MLARIAASAVLVALAGCAGVESAGRNARTAEPMPAATAAPAAAAPTPAPTPPATSAAPMVQPPQSSPAPAAAQPAAPAPQAEQAVLTPNPDDDTVVVPGARERQVQPPNGDPRSNAERMQDIRAWDRCVMRVQGAADADPLRPQLTTPEEYCRESLGMTGRTAVPASRLERR